MAGYYLNSEEGRKAQKRMKKQAGKIRKNVTHSLEAGKEEILNQVGQVADYTKEKVNALTSTLHDKFDSAVDHTEDLATEIKSRFESGVDRAKGKVQEEADKIRITGNKAAV
jgi:ElaB/YqjD/DUF883 family membrane-anchored ribosome-binding protein